MKLNRFMAGWLATMMVVTLTACGGGDKKISTPHPTTHAPTANWTESPSTNVPTELPEQPTDTTTDVPEQSTATPADNPDKAAYYATYIASPDFGLVNEDNIVSTIISNDTTMTMYITPNTMEWTLDADKVGMYVEGDTLWVLVSAQNDSGEHTDTWCKSTIPAGVDPLKDYRVDAGIVKSDDISDCSYLETVTVNGIEYDKVLLVTNLESDDALADEHHNSTYTAYITTDTHKIARMTSETTDETGALTANTLDFATTIKDPFTIPANAEEVSYEQAEMTFSFGLLAMILKTMPADMWDDIGD